MWIFNIKCESYSTVLACCQCLIPGIVRTADFNIYGIVFIFIVRTDSIGNCMIAAVVEGNILFAKLYLCCYSNFAVLMFLMEYDVFHTWVAESFQINITENSCFNGLWTPVPPEHGMCFSQELIAFHSTAGHIMYFLVFCISIVFNILENRVKYDTNLVFALFQILFYRKFPCTVHVICSCYKMIINVDICKSIQTFTDQQNLIFREQICLHRKAAFKYIIFPE